jgi:peptide chain release factor
MQKIVQLSSGRGPLECSWVVAQIADIFTQEARQAGIDIQCIKRVPDRREGTYKSIRFEVEETGNNRFLQQWIGVIQWVGQSPFRPNHKRKNWFVQFELFDEIPLIDNRDEYKVETMRASGPGGQHVNKTSSAVRITHLATDISAIAQDGRSQQQNRQLASERLREKLNDLKSKRTDTQQTKEWQQHNQLQRGNPIRIYKGMKFKWIVDSG